MSVQRTYGPVNARGSTLEALPVSRFTQSQLWAVVSQSGVICSVKTDPDLYYRRLFAAILLERPDGASPIPNCDFALNVKLDNRTETSFAYSTNTNVDTSGTAQNNSSRFGFPFFSVKRLTMQQYEANTLVTSTGFAHPLHGDSEACPGALRVVTSYVAGTTDMWGFQIVMPPFPLTVAASSFELEALTSTGWTSHSYFYLGVLSQNWPFS